MYNILPDHLWEKASKKEKKIKFLSLIMEKLSNNYQGT